MLEMVGICGIDPGPFTFRQLEIMWVAKCRLAWDQSASIRATVINMFKDKNKPECKAENINPFSEKNLNRGKG